MAVYVAATFLMSVPGDEEDDNTIQYNTCLLFTHLQILANSVNNTLFPIHGLLSQKFTAMSN